MPFYLCGHLHLHGLLGALSLLCGLFTLYMYIGLFTTIWGHFPSVRPPPRHGGGSGVVCTGSGNLA